MDPLTKAISQASPTTLRTILLNAITASSEFRSAVQDQIIITHPLNKEEEEDEIENPPKKRLKTEEGAEQTPQNEKSTKPNLVQIPRWVKCTQCNENFDTEDNREKSCEFHSGTLELDDDAFPDDDDLNDGYEMEIPGDWRVDEFPGNFTWDCCQGDADATGCELKKHCGVFTVTIV